MLGILGYMTPEWWAMFGGGYFGAETLIGYVAVTMFSEDGLKYLICVTIRPLGSAPQPSRLTDEPPTTGISNFPLLLQF